MLVPNSMGQVCFQVNRVRQPIPPVTGGNCPIDGWRDYRNQT